MHTTPNGVINGTVGGANHPNYSVISTPTMSFITPFGMVCTLHLLQGSNGSTVL